MRCGVSRVWARLLGNLTYHAPTGLSYYTAGPAERDFPELTFPSLTKHAKGQMVTW